MFSVFLLRFLPITILLLLSFFSVNKRGLISINNGLNIFICIIFIMAIASLPDDISIDKPRYISMFHQSFFWGMQDVFKDPGWMIYTIICANLFNNNAFFFILLTATVYVFSYYFFSKKYFGNNAFYFIIMSFGCLGFVAYATNTIRAGFALAFLLLSFVSEKKIWKWAFLFCSVMFHRSMIIPIGAFIMTGLIEKKWVYLSIWILCMTLSLLNVDLSVLFETFGFVDERIEGYGESINNQFSSYKKGFRLDFLLYSIVPIAFATLTSIKHQIKDNALMRMINMYVLTNSVWLLAIRINYSDRLAYLSWFLIPFITLYPVIKYKERYNNPNGIAIGIMGVFVGLNIVLMII